MRICSSWKNLLFCSYMQKPLIIVGFLFIIGNQRGYLTISWITSIFLMIPFALVRNASPQKKNKEIIVCIRFLCGIIVGRRRLLGTFGKKKCGIEKMVPLMRSHHLLFNLSKGSIHPEGENRDKSTDEISPEDQPFHLFLAGSYFLSLVWGCHLFSQEKLYFSDIFFDN